METYKKLIFATSTLPIIVDDDSIRRRIEVTELKTVDYFNNTKQNRGN